MVYDPKTIAEWFVHRAEREGEFLTQMKLQKLVYISHGWSLGLFDKPLINEQVQAWKWGPVIPPLYKEYAKWGRMPIVCEKRDAPKLPPLVKALLEKMWSVYHGFTAAQLSDMTHRQGTPWSKVYRDGVAGIPIPNSLIAKHYKELADGKSAARV
jgi:uncharacterized phage-associated protein